MSAKAITLKLARHFDYTKNIVLTRIYTRLGEADMFVIRKSMWAEEIEIKITEQDFKRDFTAKSDKHHRLLNGVPPPRLLRSETVEKHMVGFFSFAMPLALAEKLLPLAPEHCGIYGVDLDARYNRIEVLRKPERLEWSRKVTHEELNKFMRGIYWKHWRAVFREVDA